LSEITMQNNRTFMELSKLRVNFASRLLFVIVLFAVFAQTSNAQQPGMVTLGNARFTVITPELIRMEYAGTSGFVDQPSLFADNRSARDAAAVINSTPTRLTIDTPAMTLTYTPDGNPFSSTNLSAVIKAAQGGQTETWHAGDPNPGNLGGTARTLDGWDGAGDLGQGVISRDGWYVLDDSKSDLLTADWVAQRPQTAGTDWYLFGYGKDFKGALQSLTTVSGPAPLPRKYALGTWYSRYWPYTSTDYKQIVQQYTDHQFPLDNIVMDMDWHKDGWTGWSWNRALLPDAEALLEWYHQQGLHVTLNLHPADGVGPQEDQYATFMKDMGADPATKSTLPFDAGSKTYLDTLEKDVMKPLQDEGVDFWWLDWQQYPFTKSIPDLTNLFWLNTYFFDHPATAGDRGMSFSRWGGWGDQRHPIHFSGDASTSWKMLTFEVPMTSTAGNVACFYWSHDIGGHNRGRNEESYTRWCQFGATTAVLRSHSTRDATMDRRPWTYPDWAEKSMRISFQLRSQLFPYIYTSAHETSANSVPLNRPLYIDYPLDERSYHNAQEYLYGDNLLVAPITMAGVGPGRVGRQIVWFPRDSDWYNLFTGEKRSAGTQALVSADIDEFPIYARGGTPIPLQPVVMRMATTPLTELHVRCYPGADGKTGSSSLYEDDGTTLGYQHGESAATPMTYVRNGSTVTVKIGPTTGHFKGQPASRKLVIELPDTESSSATVNGATVPVSYRQSDHAVLVTTTQPLGKLVTVTVQYAPVNPADIANAQILRRMSAVEGLPITGSVENALANAAALDEPLRSAALACAGIGLVNHDQSPYLYKGTIAHEMYCPPGLVDNASAQVSFDPPVANAPASVSTATGNAAPVVSDAWPSRTGHDEDNDRGQTGDVRKRCPARAAAWGHCNEREGDRELESGRA
jgi:alpha-glucosidase (family GH31 glycosyl hydrolase)